MPKGFAIRNKPYKKRKRSQLKDQDWAEDGILEFKLKEMNDDLQR